MENRIDQKFAALKAQGKKAFVAYLTAGDPHLSKTPGLVLALEKAGADIIELGIPFSDPLADGVVNQLAAQRALESGATLQGLLDTIRTIRSQSQIPLVLFTYLNPIYHFGLEAFCQKAEQAGADGLLILDLPPEESLPFKTLLRRIPLIAPTSPPERIASIAQVGSGFIYYVSREGVTGMQNKMSETIADRVNLIRSHTQVPICVGFGISTPEQAKAISGFAEGAVIGSALVSRIGEWGKDADLEKKLEDFARPLAEAIHS